mgnify:CR=1 FL=1
MNDFLIMSPEEREVEEHRLRIQEENGRFYERMKMIGIDVSEMFERSPIYVETFGLHWHKTAENPPARKDGDAIGAVLTVGYHRNIRNGMWLQDRLGWDIVADHPERYPLWMPLPQLPDLPVPEKGCMIGYD